jgi:hypothetical protein
MDAFWSGKFYLPIVNILQFVGQRGLIFTCLVPALKAGMRSRDLITQIPQIFNLIRNIEPKK